MQLTEDDIRTKEILSWNGLHLFHGQSSSCSQKVRIYLKLKNIPWESHPVNLPAGENMTDYYLGINPRGLVPVIVHDGAVHIESNDIITYLEAAFPEPQLIPLEHRSKVAELLRHEDELHLSLRTVTFGFIFGSEKPPKTAEDLERYALYSSGTVGGVKDERLDEEIEYWRNVLTRGISDEEARAAVENFHVALTELDQKLGNQQFILGDQLSVLDIAWVVYINRLGLAGYPVARLHPNVGAWTAGLMTNNVFQEELTPAPPLAQIIASRQQILAANGRDLVSICGLN